MNNEPLRRPAPRRIILLGKEGRDDIRAFCESIRDWLRDRSVDADCRPFAPGDATIAHDVEGADLVSVFGGDGTLVSIARSLAQKPVPLLGVNFGRVGFLATVRPESWQESFSALLDHGMVLEQRMGLAYSQIRAGESIASGIAVNDIVVTRGAIARLASFELGVDGAAFGSLRADGVILSTPMGSTGYSASARGPILHPELNVFAITAICPFLSNFLPLVLDGRAVFSITAREADPELFMTVDGQQLFPFLREDRLEASGVPGCILFARPAEPTAEPTAQRRRGNGAYYEKLRDAGFIGPV